MQLSFQEALNLYTFLTTDPFGVGENGKRGSVPRYFAPKDEARSDFKQFVRGLRNIQNAHTDDASKEWMKERTEIPFGAALTNRVLSYIATAEEEGTMPNTVVLEMEDMRDLLSRDRTDNKVNSNA